MNSQTKHHPVIQNPEYIQTILEGIGPLGDTYTNYKDHKINVFGGIPGEEVIAQIVQYKRRRQHYISALVTEVIKPSPHRVAPPCPYFGPCTGCQWQHIEYSHQLQLKQEAVENQLELYPDLRNIQVFPTVPDPKLYNYRNHARFSVRSQGALGFVNRITRRFIKIDECIIMAPEINKALSHLQGNCQETSQISVRYGINTSDMLIQPTLNSPSISLNSGQPHYYENLLDSFFRVSSPSFFQVNTTQTEKMVALMQDRLQLTGNEVLVDAYAGVGTFTILFAPFVRKIIAIEESGAAVKDAAVNTLGIRNLKFIESKTEEALDNLDESVDAIILDPPRVGCHPSAIESTIRLGPKRILYISCDPATLARDLNLLVHGGFRIKAVEPIDMFPQTHHVECVTTLDHETSSRR